ncbi:hypothetical protein XM40_18525 [Bacillus velezensis]|nr:hypothetical protein SB45_18500 [Bacillus velezensis]AKD24106.1 hypothetical protein XM40_18525 [Bacillus velezensis]ODB69908.1 hypothetical protein A7310_08675 [Bacillus velezensis]
MFHDDHNSDHEKRSPSIITVSGQKIKKLKRTAQKRIELPSFCHVFYFLLKNNIFLKPQEKKRRLVFDVFFWAG